MTAQRKPKAPAPAQYAPKKKYVAAIHAAQGALRLTEDDARSLKLAVIGVASCKDMTEEQQAKLLKHLNGLVDSRDKKDWQDPRWRKAVNSWRILHEAGAVRENTMRALRIFCKNTVNVDHWSWMNDREKNKVVDHLVAWRNRVGT